MRRLIPRNDDDQPMKRADHYREAVILLDNARKTPSHDAASELLLAANTHAILASISDLPQLARSANDI